MIVSFETHELQQVCCSLEIAAQRFGDVHAQSLVAMIADLEAFNQAEEMIAFVGDGGLVAEDDSLSLPVGSDYLATFIAVGTRFARNQEGRVLWSSVTRLKLLSIVGCQ